MKKVNTNSPNGCWIWIASTGSGGYGQFAYNGTMCLSHRISWEIHNGPIPEGMTVRHHCPNGDNIVCVNPDHLRLGTHQDNMDDKVAAGRQARGEDLPQTKLSQEDVEVIRHLYDNKDRFNMTQGKIAEEFGVSQQQIFQIVRRKQWR